MNRPRLRYLRDWYRYVAKYELQRKQERFLFWLAAKLPKRLAYFSFITSGVQTIRNDEVVPEVLYVDLLKRHPGGP